MSHGLSRLEVSVNPEQAISPPEPQLPEPEKKEQYHRNWIAEWTLTLLLLLFGTATLVQAYVIPTGSMEDTLLVGDHLLVDKLSYAPQGSFSRWLLPYTDVKRGDIIVFRYPVNPKDTYVKRVIGMPGDHLRITNKQVYINGQKLNEPYKFHKSRLDDPYRDNFPSQNFFNTSERGIEMLENHVSQNELVIPPNSYFAMGDNRDNSLDSRYWGFVPRENIIGKPLLIYWSFDAGTGTLSGALQHFFSKTRWNRSFQLIHGYPSKN